ncbi:MFS transporter [Streptomyces lushanensis]|uniref:MFS transporter n=1 Tax=Streptomyces lushanensis TaxID=1434255 RepID=UPI00082D3087|nr:MFS transporter [Streptomyces lushanensis]
MDEPQSTSRPPGRHGGKPSAPGAEAGTRRRDLTLYWWGQTASAFGSVFTAIALPIVAVVHLGASAMEVGLLSAAATLPVLLLGLPAGALADRITRPRRALLALDCVSAVTVAAVALGLAHDIVTVVWLACLSAALGAISTLTTAVYFLHLKQLAGADGIGPARARLQAGQYGASLLGRLLSGPAVAVLGGASALALDAVSYLLSAVALLSMRLPDRMPPRAGQPLVATLRGAADGLRFFTKDPFHRALAVFIVVPTCTAAAMTALTSPFLLRTLELPAEAFGAVFALSGVMGLGGSAVAARLLRPGSDARRVALLTFTLAVACTLLLPLSAGPPALAAPSAALGIGLPVFFGAIANVAVTSVLVADVPEAVLGRSMAALQVCTAAAGILGALMGGALGSRWGVREALWAMALLGLAAVLANLPRALRTARRLREAAEGTAAVREGPVEAERPT